MLDSDCVGSGITIAVLTADRTHLLCRLLNLLLPQTDENDQVVILDTNPSPANEELVNHLGSSRIRYHAKAIKPFNFSVARNHLLSLACSGPVVFIDDDAVPFSNWLETVKHNLQKYDASGGVVLSEGTTPAWWSPHINWCVGLSGPGSVLHQPGHYPDTCNLAMGKDTWPENRFQNITIGSDEHLYASGREDAEWWYERRIHGSKLTIDYRQAVIHTIHPDRINFKYIFRRGFKDGETSWHRRPLFDGATGIPWDLAHAGGVFIDAFLRRPWKVSSWLPALVWAARQTGRYHAVWKAPSHLRPRHRHAMLETVKATVFQAKIRVGRLLFKVVAAWKHFISRPLPATPTLVFVSADCLIGDTVLLRYPIQALADSYPEARIMVSARFPELLAGLRNNVVLMRPELALEFVKRERAALSAAIVPYFHSGDIDLWRKCLSPISTSFNCDVGFPGRRDYMYTKWPTEKDLSLHEMENLYRLFSLWPLSDTRPVPLPEPASPCQEWLNEILSSIDTDKFVTIQLGAGYAAKEWPEDYWAEFLRGFVEAAKCPIFLIGNANCTKSAVNLEESVRSSGGNVCNLVGRTSLDQLIAVISSTTLLIGACSGPKHIAFEYGTPTYTLYIATEPHRWGAWRDHHLHAYSQAVFAPLTRDELHGLRPDHRARLLKPETVLEGALNHYFKIAHLNRKEEVVTRNV